MFGFFKLLFNLFVLVVQKRELSLQGLEVILKGSV